MARSLKGRTRKRIWTTENSARYVTSMSPTLFDRTLLPEALGEFVVISDTHYALAGGVGMDEFPSRAQQSQRAGAALRLVAALDPDFVVHMGDVVQEYPESAGFIPALDQALAQMAACGVQPRWVAGNHDLGDKPDPTMPTHPVTAEGLDAYHRRFGPSWYSFDYHDLHLVVLNSQILNTGLPAEEEQRTWLEADLAAHAQTRIAVFLHLPPYLHNPAEPHLGHYDNIGEPARTWLLELLAAHQVDWLFAAHVHFAFCEPAGTMYYRTVPSTSFARPGLSHLFSSAPPPEQGRNDQPKLGFYLCRLRHNRLDIHLIRTAGAQDWSPGPRRLLTPATADLGGAPLGLTATHPLGWETEVPITFPSVVRQPVRNDYPLLACLELGAQALRCPWTDLDSSRDRLRFLRRQGVQVQATILDDENTPYESILESRRDHVDTWEIQTPGRALALVVLPISIQELPPQSAAVLGSGTPRPADIRQAAPPHPNRLPTRRGGPTRPSIAKRGYVDRSGPVPTGRNGPLGRRLGLARGKRPDHDGTARFAL